VLLPEKDCTAQGLYDQVKELLADNARRGEMKKALGAMAVADSAERICDILEELIRSR
jgi:UDP-N-acetylglucosamine--N-acetylmuramyl-(pentapeptide) pyrophosphoryl-undecaprenol N-acetylglucosamine transferase